MKTKVATVFAIMGILLFIMVGTVTYFVSDSRVKAFYVDLAFNSARMAAEIVSGEDIDGFLAYGSNERYYETFAALYTLKRLFDITYLYVIRPGEEYRSAVFIFDIYTDETEPEHIMQLGDIITATDVFDYDTMLEIFLTGEAMDSAMVTYTRFGHLASAYVPVFASDGSISAVAVVDISMNMIVRDVRYQTAQISLAVLVFIILFLAIWLVLIQWQVVTPIEKLSGHMKNYDGGELPEFTIPRTGGTNDEIQDITKSLNQMIKNMNRFINETAERERIIAEFNMAKEIQESMLPSISDFPKHNEFDIHATMVPALQVGGDFYDFFMIDEENLAIVIADVSDKGMPAALFMVISKILIKSNAQYDSGKPLNDVFNIVNSLLCENNEAGMFVTAFIGKLNIKTGNFTYVNAGHNPPLLRIIEPEGSLFNWLEAKPDFFLAGDAETYYNQNSISLNPGDELFLYTDGVTEAANLNKEYFGDALLLETINKYRGLPLEKIVALVLQNVRTFANGAKQSDDITMLMLRYNGGAI
ncbi:MAG: PP2C family protein-serine/threonine phosphatase [Defluviitaleaceae bacterium]|nr:PP2C family protein-serine/threonine phosphatase [Defluviitaleaceae bacterium]